MYLAEVTLWVPTSSFFTALSLSLAEVGGGAGSRWWSSTTGGSL